MGHQLLPITDITYNIQQEVSFPAFEGTRAVPRMTSVGESLSAVPPRIRSTRLRLSEERETSPPQRRQRARPPISRIGEPTREDEGASDRLRSQINSSACCHWQWIGSTSGRSRRGTRSHPANSASRRDGPRSSVECDPALLLGPYLVRRWDMESITLLSNSDPASDPKEGPATGLAS